MTPLKRIEGGCAIAAMLLVIPAIVTSGGQAWFWFGLSVLFWLRAEAYGIASRILDEVDRRRDDRLKAAIKRMDVPRG